MKIPVPLLVSIVKIQNLGFDGGETIVKDFVKKPNQMKIPELLLLELKYNFLSL